MPRLWVALVVVATALLVAHVAFRGPLISGDTVAVVQGSHAIQTCLDLGIHRRCNEFGGAGVVVPQFPPLQYAPAYVLLALGFNDIHILKGLSILNVLAFVCLVALFGYVAGRTKRPWVAPLLLLTAIASPLLVYSWYTFGELLAGLLVATPVALGLLRPRPILLALLVMLAVATKETALVFVVPSCALALWATPLAQAGLRRGHWIALAGGTVLGLLSHVALNQFRYGTFTNEIYTRPGVQTPGIKLPAEFLVSLWWAPNGGTVFFWPVAAAILVIPFVTLAGLALRRERSVRAWVVPAVIVGLVCLHTALFARVAAPFGWIAWGARYMYALLPTLVLLTVILQLDATQRALQWIGSHVARRIAVAAVVVLFALPQVGVLFDQGAIGRFFIPEPTNERCPRVAFIGEGDVYFDCIEDLAWSRPSPLLDATSGIGDGLGPLYLLVFGAATGALVFAATTPRPRTAAPRS